MSETITGLWPFLRDKLNGVVYRMEDDGLKVDIFSGYRSKEEQDKLYALGRTVKNPDGIDSKHPLGRIVTNARGGDSFHNFGLAADIVFKIGDKWSWSEKLPWGLLGHHIKALGLEWGGDFKTIQDKPHVQLVGGITLKEMRGYDKLPDLWEEVYRRLMSY